MGGSLARKIGRFPPRGAFSSTSLCCMNFQYPEFDRWCDQRPVAFWQRRVRRSPGSTSAGTGDFNGDGKSDILWRDTSGNVAIWEMNGTTVLNPNTAGVGNVTTNFKIAGSGDFNGDGKSDVLWRDTTGGNVAIWFMNGTSILNPNAAGVGNVPLIWTIQNPLGG